ncbi:TatD family hydrolase [Chelatococcus reniformis]|uniref:LuxR family transcriptional regulator n=1 Tax=Chelatococcus reniformis TaxID=1494448 RepID=A0A916U191_9HYPH|nr:TatD family hydrolase [Chelatococcus reniformis]GGC56638.1 LuxR family transcriptional regulator [Chelatococcus reniformis]
MLVDSHCHLDYFTNELAQIIARAEQSGIGRMVSISTHVRKAATYRALAESDPRIFFTVGTHPHHAGEEADVTTAEIVALAEHPRCVGIGEAGLDYFYDRSPRDVQAKVFRTNIAAARQSGLPLVIHARDADADMIAILEDEMGKGAFKALLHCFSSGAALAEAGVALGLYVSFSGILTFRRSEEIRRIAAEVPLDRLLVETDAPYLAPEPYRGKRNEPAYTALTAKVLADVRAVDEEEIARVTTANFYRLFAKAAEADRAAGMGRPAA